MIGRTLGQYEISAKLGEGGMGQVYKAHDTKLKRDVAIKVLPDSVANDPERLARFEREAHTLASLNHPNIAQIYGVEDSTPMRALVMELVPGRTLDELIPGLSMTDSIAIARQIADALEAAHDHGIVHRDLKPANIKVKDDGTVKVLDFGLAKTTDGGSATESATMTSPAMTAAGFILGTAAYMSPEQARGKPVDRRSDIWAFGAILFEMLSGRRLFEGETVSDLIAGVLRQDVPWNSLPEETPPSLRRLLRRCLERDPRKRLTAIGDARLDLDDAMERDADAAPLPAATTPAARDRKGFAWPIVLATAATAAAAAALAVVALRPSPVTAPASVARATLLGPEGIPLYPDPAEIVISPDGKYVVFSTGDRADQSGQLWLRSLDSLVARRLEGADGARLAFWSPDSRRIGFFAEGKLKTLSIDGGRPTIVCDAASFRGGTWNASGIIVFAPASAGGLARVSENGGTPAPLTTLDASKKQTNHRFPWFLPDGEHFLYAALPAREGRFDIYIGSLSGGAPQLLDGMESAPVYVEPGWLLFLRQGALSVQRFDASRRALTGEVLTLADVPGGLYDPATMWTAGHSATASSTGILAYLANSVDRTKAVWFDAAGNDGGELRLPSGNYRDVRISPTGKHAALVRQNSPIEAGIALVDLEQQTTIPITTGRGANSWPAWSPDGNDLAFTSDRDGVEDLYVKHIGTTAPESVLYHSSANFKQVNGWSPDSKWFLFHQVDPDSLQNVYMVPAAGGGTARTIAAGPRREAFAKVSPDGNWVAYLSDEPGQFQLFVQRFPEPAARTSITSVGVVFHKWRKDSRQIVFSNITQSAVYAIDVDGTGATFRAMAPRQIMTLPKGVVGMDATPDLKKYLVIVPEAPTAPLSVTVVTNWLAGVK